MRGVDRAVLRGVSFSIAPGEAYGLVGESGCGKSTTAYAALRYLRRTARSWVVTSWWPVTTSPA